MVPGGRHALGTAGARLLRFCFFRFTAAWGPSRFCFIWHKYSRILDQPTSPNLRGLSFPLLRPLVAYSPLTLASLRMLPCRTHWPRPSTCIMHGCGTACGTTLFARYCHVTPRQKPPKVGSGGFGDGAPPGAVRAWIGLSGRFLALAICPRRAPHAGIRGYGPRRRLEALVISARSRPLEVGSRSRRDHSRLAKPP